MDHDGNITRNPNEILHEWTYEQVLDALEVRLIRQKRLKALRDRPRPSR